MATGGRIEKLVLVGVLVSSWNSALAQRVESIDADGATVSDVNRSLEFFSQF